MASIRTRSRSTGKNAQTVDTDGASARLRWDLGGDNVLSSITGWEHVHSFSRGDVDGGYGAAYDLADGSGRHPVRRRDLGRDVNGHEQLSQEFRLEHGGAGPPHVARPASTSIHEKYKISSLAYDTLFGGAEHRGRRHADQHRLGRRSARWAMR